MKAQLIDVGRAKYSGTIDIPDNTHPDAIAHLIWIEAKKHLVSRDVQVNVDMESMTGKIHAGFHCVGQVRLVKEKK